VFQLAADKEAPRSAVAMRENGIRVLVETDDNYLASPGKQIRDRQQWGKKIGDGRAHSAEGHRWIVRAGRRRDRHDRLPRPPVPQGQPERLRLPEHRRPVDWPDPRSPTTASCGSSGRVASHSADIPLVTRAFEWASRQPGVEVYVTGLDPRWPFKYGRSPGSTTSTATARTSALRHRRRADQVGRRRPFALGRSDVKALEYAMGGCAPVLSDVAPYALWTDGENCMKAADAKGFLRAIQHLVRTATSEAARRRRTRVHPRRAHHASADPLLAGGDQWLTPITECPKPSFDLNEVYIVNGRPTWGINMTVTTEHFEQYRLGYRCIACHHFPQPEAFPDNCCEPYCQFPMKRRASTRPRPRTRTSASSSRHCRSPTSCATSSSRTAAKKANHQGYQAP
jgi:hypothetical protein